MKYAAWLIGPKEWALRLPNILAFIMYILFAHKLTRNFSPLLRISIGILLAANCLLFDLFSLARGYGLAWGFMVACLYHFIQYQKEGRARNLLFFHGTALLASLSNFTLLTVYVSLLILSPLTRQQTQKKKWAFLTDIYYHLAPTAISAGILFEPVRRAIQHSTFDFGGSKGLYADTLQSVLEIGLQNTAPSPAVSMIIKIGLTLLVVIPVFLILNKTYRKALLNHIELFITSSLLVLLALMLIALHKIMQADYPISRFSAFILPLIFLQIGYFVHFLEQSKKTKWIVAVPLVVATMYAGAFIYKFNPHQSAEWGYDANTKDMMFALKAHEKEHNNNSSYSLGVNWLFEPTTNFYRITRGFEKLDTITREPYSIKHNYIYTFKKDLDTLKSFEYEVVKDYGDAALIWNKKKIKD